MYLFSKIIPQYFKDNHRKHAHSVGILATKQYGTQILTHNSYVIV